MNQSQLTLTVLVSCMHEKDRSIIDRSNIQTDAIIINQCDDDRIDEWDFKNKVGQTCHVKMIYTRDRGLSRSRNMAIRNATSDICLICDDDELLTDEYANTIIEAFSNNPSYDIIAFNLNNPETEYPLVEEEISYWKTGKLASWQIAFKRNERVLSSPFNEMMGSGTGNGGGEENKFLLDCLAKGAKIKYCPELIGEVAQSESMWFHGFDKKYWINRGWIAKMLYGKGKALCYITGQVLLRVRNVDKNNSPYRIFFWMLKGWSENRSRE